jgi:hypothetical protein
MKKIIPILIITAVLYSCSNSAQKTADEVQATIKESTPGSIATSADGYTMKAKLDGKEWDAGSMTPVEASGRIIGYNHGEYIGLPYSKSDMVAGRKNIFGPDNAVDLSTNDNAGLWGGQKGEMEITKVDDKWIEGKFFFTATSSASGKTIEVTDGFFRIPVENN